MAAMAAHEEDDNITLTQGSKLDLSQGVVPTLQDAWGRLVFINYDDGDVNYITSIDLTVDFTGGRDALCEVHTIPAINKSISRIHFIIEHENSAPLSPPILIDCSYNGTYVNECKVGEGKRRVLNDNDEISLAHPKAKMFVFKDLLKRDHEEVPEELTQKYYISRVLGEGGCGIVKLVYEKLNCEKYAMKILKKVQTGESNMDEEDCLNEVNLILKLNHPCVIRIKEIFDSPSKMFIILELMEGGDLSARIAEKEKLSEPQLKFLFRQMVLAVRYLHSQGIAHRDLKPENILLQGPDDETIVKIADFGLSKYMDADRLMHSQCGTLLYFAPEILKSDSERLYGPEVDVWSLGVIFYKCITGRDAYSGKYEGMTLCDQVRQGRINYNSVSWTDVSKPALELIRRMLTINPYERITPDQILDSEWMQDPVINTRVDQLLFPSAQPICRGSPDLFSSSDEENRVSIQPRPDGDNISVISIISSPDVYNRSVISIESTVYEENMSVASYQPSPEY